MSEVQRFWSHEASNIRCVREADFDRVTAERDAVRETLENSYTAEDHERLVAKGQELNVKYIEKLEQRLTAEDERADHWRGVASEATCRAAGLNERVDVLEGSLREFFDSRSAVQAENAALGNITSEARYDRAIDLLEAALKPAEGGGDER